MDKYTIINESIFLTRIEDLKNAISKCILPEQQHLKDLFEQELEIKTQILSQSTPLIPEIEKAWETCSKLRSGQNVGVRNKTEYISNLKLDI